MAADVAVSIFQPAATVLAGASPAAINTPIVELTKSPVIAEAIVSTSVVCMRALL